MSALGSRTALSRLIDAFGVPWGAFVAAFVYYTVLAVIAIGFEQVSSLFIVISYALPPLAYAGLLLNRGVQAVARVQVDLGQTPELQLH